ncbi:MAG: Ger(x)C family spore germination protein [Oscillospiraceae bacterium]|jgi:spore germination protein KC|nr:Ger(x)C family spore germination protein [Oscillospiraceae bacterium]
MKKKICLITGMALIFVCLCSCWDYRSLSRMTIVAGIAVDQSDADPEKYLLTFETIDDKNIKAEGLFSDLVKAEGGTIAEAIFSARKQLKSELYLGNTEIILISKAVAQNGIGEIVDTFLRNVGTRETLSLIIADSEKAYDIFETDANDIVMSYIINKSFNESYPTSDSIHWEHLFDIYDDLCEGIRSLTLPVIRRGGEDGDIGSNGMAIFDGDKMAGQMEEWQKPYYALIMDAVKDGSFVCFIDGYKDFPDDQDEGKSLKLSLRIRKTVPKISVEEKDGKYTLVFKLFMPSNVIDIFPGIGGMNTKNMLMLGGYASLALNQEIEKIVKYHQRRLGLDIFGFGESIYRNDPGHWNQIKDDWGEIFKKADVSADTQIVLRDAGMMKDFGGGRGVS